MLRMLTARARAGLQLGDCFENNFGTCAGSDHVPEVWLRHTNQPEMQNPKPEPQTLKPLKTLKTLSPSTLVAFGPLWRPVASTWASGEA